MIRIQQNPPETIVHFENPNEHDTPLSEKALEMNAKMIIGAFVAYYAIKEDMKFSASLITATESMLMAVEKCVCGSRKVR